MSQLITIVDAQQSLNQIKYQHGEAVPGIDYSYDSGNFGQTQIYP